MATNIILQCIDKTLSPVSLPKLTSGGKKDIRLEVQFGSDWSGYTGRVATFWRDKALVHHVALVQDACEVPWSDVFEPGILTVAVFGVRAGVVKTSEAIDLVIEQGAITGASSMEPIPDVYQQLLAAYGKVSAAQAVESARLDQVLAGATADGAEASDIRVSAEGLTYAAAGEAVRDQIARVRSEASHASIYDLDAVKDHLGLTRVNGVDAVVGQITDETKTWQYAHHDIALQPGLYTVVVRDLHIPAGGFFAIAASVTGQKYLKITEPGIYTMGVYDDGQNYNPEAVPMVLQMAQDVGMPVGVYYAAGVSVYSGDVTILPAFPETLTGADKKLDKQVGKNLFNKNSPEIERYKFLSGGGVPTVNEYSGIFYCTGFIPIEAETVYTLTDYKIGGAYIVFYDERKSFISGLDGGNNLDPAGGVFTTPAGAAYVRLTGNIANLDTNQLEKGDRITAYEVYTEYAPAGDSKRRLDIMDKRLNAPAVEVVERSTLAAGESMVIASPNAKNHNVISFSAKVDSFSSLVVSHGKREPFCSGYVVIDASHAHVYAFPNATTKLAAYAHGLYISGYLRVNVQVMDGSSARLTISTASGSFSQVIEWNGSRRDVMVESQGSTLTDCVLTYYLEGLRCPVWMFGDSYFDYWPKVLAGWGYTDYYLDSYSGRGSAAALESLQKCLRYAAPQTLVWCMGMNDNDATWSSVLESVKMLCEQYDTELVLATVPNVSSRDHSAKNDVVRASGFRIVDFCEAVGADNSTAWINGLLGGDGVHPSERGAVALASRALVDLPELTEIRSNAKSPVRGIDYWTQADRDAIIADVLAALETDPPVVPIKIIQQPADVYAAIGDNVEVPVIAEGEGLTYVWYFANPGQNSFSASSDTDNSYTTTLSESRVGRRVYCVISDANGNSVTTEVATIYQR